ncbi:MAG: hypothetical protein MMC33_010729 [Icmadophila ericetorum]|nr:hypothetical protein [Icmadophila ericetorum]
MEPLGVRHSALVSPQSDLSAKWRRSAFLIEHTADDSQDNGIGVMSCGNGMYCCESGPPGSSDCCSDSTLFKLSDGILLSILQSTSTTFTTPTDSSTVSSRTQLLLTTMGASSTLLSTTFSTSSSTSSFVPASPSPTLNSSSSSRSTTAKIAIGVTVPIALILLVLAGLALYRQGKRRAPAMTTYVESGNPLSQDAQRNSGRREEMHEKDGLMVSTELLGRPVVELGGQEPGGGWRESPGSVAFARNR